MCEEVISIITNSFWENVHKLLQSQGMCTIYSLITQDKAGTTITKLGKIGSFEKVTCHKRTG